LVDGWAARGRYHFTSTDVAAALAVSDVAARAALRRLRAKGVVASPQRGFHVFVPPEYRTRGCLPSDQFVPQLMAHLGLDYYVGLLSAAERHGSAHQRPQVFQVMAPANRRRIRCGRSAIQFVARRNVAEMPKQALQTPRGDCQVSSRETTAIDLVGYPRRSGGLSNVATVLIELVQGLEGEGRGLDDASLVTVARLSPVPWTQRLGFLIEEYTGMKLPGLAELVRRQAREYVALRPERRGPRRPARSPRWRLVVNDVVEPDL
jgi:predicted transcriptional regulator of viral defense system